MNKKYIKTMEENRLHGNALKTTLYLFDALREEDYESCKIELEELKFTLEKLEDLKAKRERREMLSELIADMKNRGINIDFAKRASFLSMNAKNVAEIYRDNSNTHKKRQQA